MKTAKQALRCARQLGAAGPYAAAASVEEWEKRKAVIAGKIAAKTGINFSQPCEAPPFTVTGETHFGAYSVQNVYWQTLGHYCTAGNIFLPAGHKGKRPAVMLPHGHFEHGRFNEDSQRLAVRLALLGCAVFLYDMVGWGEDTQTPHADKYNNALQLHNSRRILDHISTRPDIDDKKIAVTGASGGGTQTMMLTAFDNRIAASVPVCMLSATFNGGCKCESGLGYFSGRGFHTSHAEIAAMAAPRPMLVISIGNDWTKTVPETEFPCLKRIYGLYGRQDAVKNVHFADGRHDYCEQKRDAATLFLALALGFDPGGAEDPQAVIPAAEQMTTFTPFSPRPSQAYTQPKELFRELLAYYQQPA